MKFFNKTLLISVVVLLGFGIIGVGGYYLYEKITDKIHYISKYQSETAQFLMSNIDYKTERLRMVMFGRDFIRKIDPKISLDEAFAISQSNVKWCEVYPSQDPLLKLALQWKESTFKKDAVSPMGAVGINQVMPYMARLLCRGYGITYSDSLLKNIDMNNRISSQMFEEALANYNGNIQIALACYNGGPYSALYFRTGNDRLNEETKAYVPDVINKYTKLKEQYMNYYLDMNQLVPDSTLLKKKG